MSDAELQNQLEAFRTDYSLLKDAVCRAVIGQKAAVEASLAALLAGGHVLVEGLPGTGKTLLAQTLSNCLSLGFRRIQFTPDLMPADVIGTSIVMEVHGRRKFEFQQGPIFSQLVLIDEVNRATPKTQSALLEAMEDGAVTVGNETYDLPEPFFVIATQSPGTADGTFPLPQTQLDRFLLKVQLDQPDGAALSKVLERGTAAKAPPVEQILDGPRLLEMQDLARRIAIAPEVRQYAVDLLQASDPRCASASDEIKKYAEHGAGVRGGLAMLRVAQVKAILSGRVNVSKEDIRATAADALRHRIALNFEGLAEQTSADSLVESILN